MLTRTLLALTLLLPVACQAKDLTQAPPVPPDTKLAGGLQLATFAGGCFWCMEGPFEKLEGVVSVVSGFTDGPEPNPTYSQVSSGTTGHTEAIQVTFDPSKISYEKLVETFWHNIDPHTANRQFCDGGTQYRTGLFVHDAALAGPSGANRVAWRKASMASCERPRRCSTAPSLSQKR